jgi:hypothetical protein
MRKLFSKKGDIEIDVLGWWILAIVVLVLGVMIIISLKGKGIGFIDALKNLFRFGK